MVEGYSFYFSVVSPLVAIAAFIFSLITMIGSAIDLGRAPWEHSVPRGYEYSAFVLTGFGVISQFLGWISGNLASRKMIMDLDPLFTESLFAFSVIFLIATIINKKRRYSD